LSIERLLKRAVKEIRSGQIINLGIGLPTQLINYLPDDMDVMLHSENGILGSWKKTDSSRACADLIDAGGNYVTSRKGASYFDSAVSFAMIRKGRIDLSIIGTFEVDQYGNLANWKIPGKFSPGIGGAMELAQKTPRLLVLTTHTDKKGRSKILKNCRLPLTACDCVNRIITDCAVMDVTDKGLELKEVVEGKSIEEIVAITEAELIIPKQIKRF